MGSKDFVECFVGGDNEVGNVDSKKELEKIYIRCTDIDFVKLSKRPGYKFYVVCKYGTELFAHKLKTYSLDDIDWCD